MNIFLHYYVICDIIHYYVILYIIVYYHKLTQLHWTWTEVLQIINLMLSYRDLGPPTRRAGLRGERHWRGAAASQRFLIY